MGPSCVFFAMLGLTGKCKWSLLLSLFLSVSCVFMFCEYVIYFPTILRCSWPELKEDSPTAALRALFLSDTHLLGAIKGHWFDKLRRCWIQLWRLAAILTFLSLTILFQVMMPLGTIGVCCAIMVITLNVVLPSETGQEWQMERAFQTALWLLKPEMVFILGDIFDEGKWSSPKDWEDDVRRFKQIFRHPSETELVVLIGNHDVGFHHEMTHYKLERFEKVFNVTSARIITKKGVNFLLVNSVALHGDHCPICQSVENELRTLSQALNCSIKSVQSDGMRHRCRDVQTYLSTAPIILQHYPLYRASDAECTGEDAAPPNERYQPFQERYDVLSQEASKRLLWWFQPRLILSGHTHSGCEVLHESRIPEISVPSFSWRNRNNPSFILGSFSQSEFALSKCFLPEESSIIAVYCGSAMAIALITLGHISLFRGALHLTSSLLGKHKGL